MAPQPNAWYEFLANDAELQVWYDHTCDDSHTARLVQQNTIGAMKRRGIECQTRRTGATVRTRILRRGL